MRSPTYGTNTFIIQMSVSSTHAQRDRDTMIYLERRNIKSVTQTDRDFNATLTHTDASYFYIMYDWSKQ